MAPVIIVLDAVRVADHSHDIVHGSHFCDLDGVYAIEVFSDMSTFVAKTLPKRSELANMAVRVLLELEETGPQKQNDLATKFEMEAFEMSKLLNKLEAAGYVRRHRDGTDKIVTAINPTSSERESTPHSTVQV